MKLLLVGDLSIQSRAAKKEWNATQLMRSFDGVRSLSKECDHSIVNLESPVTDSEIRIAKDGPTLKNPEVVFDIIKFCGFDTVTLANNHLKDFGSKGVTDTIERCNESNILFVGAGKNIEKAREHIIYEKEGIRIGLLNVCEHESSIAKFFSPGAAPYDLTNLFYDIEHLRGLVDKVIVIIHGGCEHYPLPTPRMKREYRLLIDFGADVIVNHHQHCYSGYEIYKGRPIFYGLGNFFFDNPHKINNRWNEGILLRLDITKEKTGFNLTPFSQCDIETNIEIHDYEDIRPNIDKLNEIIADDKLLNDSFDKLIASKKPLSPFLPYGNHYLRALYNRGLLPDGMTEHRKVFIENAISCETHREVLLHYFENYLHND